MLTAAEGDYLAIPSVKTIPLLGPSPPFVMRPAPIDDEGEALQDSEGEAHSELPPSWSKRIQLLLMSRGPPRVRRVTDWLYGVDTNLGVPTPWLRLPSTKGPINLELLWVRWTRPFTSPTLLAILIAAYIVSYVRIIVRRLLALFLS